MKNTTSTSNSNAGFILIAIGLFLLVTRNANFVMPDVSEFMVLPTVSALFILAGIFSQKIGLLVPGGILGGISATAFLTENPYEWSALQGVDEGAVFFFCFALGWASIALFGLFIERKVQWWALLVGGIFALLGAAIGFGGVFLSALELLGKAWPVILIAVGLKVLMSNGKREIA